MAAAPLSLFTSLKPAFARAAIISAPVARESGSCGDGHALYTDELQVLLRCAFDVQAEFDGLANSLGDLVK